MYNEFALQAAQIACNYGLDNQLSIAQEECAELIQALSKFRRAEQKRDGEFGGGADYITARTHVAEEMADVAIMLLQLTSLLCNEPMVEFWMKQKLSRTLQKMEAGA